MSIPAPSSPISRAKLTVAIFATLVPQVIGIFGLLPRYAFGEGGADLRILSVALAFLALLAFGGLWLRAQYALWVVLVVVSFQATVDLCAVALNIHGTLALISLMLLAVTTVVVFMEGMPAASTVSPYQRILFALVLAFAAWVAIWGLFLPEQMKFAIPLAVPPLHARFLGAMYLSGAVLMLLGLIARVWDEVRVVTLMLALWTGMLGLVSTLHLKAFDWSFRPTWFWFVAYIGYPLIAFWISWCQRFEAKSKAGPTLSGPLRAYLYIQGAFALALAFALLLTPVFMTTIWPWGIPPLIAQIYGAPFLSFGIGALYSARQRTWLAVRSVILGTLVFSATVVVASILHVRLFNFHTPSAWLWFGSFTIAGLCLFLFAVLPSFRSTSRA